MMPPLSAAICVDEGEVITVFLSAAEPGDSTAAQLLVSVLCSQEQAYPADRATSDRR
jgi:hypothetical protein